MGTLIDYEKIMCEKLMNDYHYTKKNLSIEMSNGESGILEIDSALYLFQITFSSQSCFRIKFTESIPPLKGVFGNQIWMTKSNFYNINVVEILTKEHIRDLKIESINE